MRRTIIALSIIAVIAFIIRVVPHLSHIFTPVGTLYMCADPFYHMRLVDYTLENFPRFLTYDMFALYPDGAPSAYRPLLTWIVATLCWIVGLGNPSENLINTIAVYVPPVLGALMTIPVYFLGKEVFSARTGIIGAALVAFLPTELLHRSLLGFTDHHILEALLATTTILFLVMAEKRGGLKYYLLSGLFLGLSLWNWHGAMWLAAIIYIWFLVQLCFKQANLKASLVFLVAFIIFAPYIMHSNTKLEYTLPLMAITFQPLIWLSGKLNQRLFIPLLVALIGAILAIIYYFIPALWDMLKFQFMSVFWGFGSSIMEAQPVTSKLVFFSYGFAIVLAMFGFALALAHKKSTLFIVWAVILGLAYYGQQRWGYYTTIPIALLAGYCFDRILANTGKRLKAAVAISLSILLIFPAIPGLVSVSDRAPDITTDWHETCVWLKDNTPAPCTEQSYYQSDSDKPSYGVLSWWDYGHWIIRIGHRVPLESNTYQVNPAVARYLTAQTTIEAENAIEELNVKYVIVDYDMVSGKFYAIVQQANGTMDGWEKLLPNSMANRLYTGQVSGYQLIYVNGGIKVFEKINQ